MRDIGFYPDMPEDEYHADPAMEPSLSSTICADLFQYTPRHVWAYNRRLNPKYKDSSTDSANDGKILHDLVLLGQNKAELLPFDSWRTNDSKAARELAKANGKIPVLLKDWPEYQEIRDALFDQIKAHPEHSDALQGGNFESSLITKFGGIYARCRFDDVCFDTDTIDDYKTTGVRLDKWIDNQLFGEYKDLQAIHYMRCYEAYIGRKPKRFRYIVQETFEPFCMAVVELDSHALDKGYEYHDWCMKKWAQLVKVEPKTWIGYSPRTHYAEMPSYAETRRELKMFNEEISQK